MISKKAKCKLVAEIGINHNGDMENVKRLIRMASLAGFDYVKFQKRNVTKTTPPEKWDVLKRTPWGEIPYIKYKRRLEDIDYDSIEICCQQEGIQWFASPWDVDSVNFLDRYHQRGLIKVASACVTDLDLLRAIRDSGRPVILSTGMSTKQQFDVACGILTGQIKYILACTSTYPTAPEEMNLQFLRTLKKEYPFAKIGFSNHNPGILFAASSVLYGAEMIEVHTTLDRAMFGSDQAASIELEGMIKLQKYVRSLEKGMGDGK